MEEQSMHSSSIDKAAFQTLSTGDQDLPKKKKWKGPSGPNPLSVKKKKVQPEPSNKDKGTASRNLQPASTSLKRKYVEDITMGDARPHKRKRRRRGKEPDSVEGIQG
jgi:U3 small nucleolar RNA-associated protein 23